MAPSLERLAKNQALFREVNERINEIRPKVVGFVEFLCECSFADCRESVALRPEEYEDVRRDATRFFIAPGHVAADVEAVVADQGRFLVVEKTIGRDYMVDTDPRSRTQVG